MQGDNAKGFSQLNEEQEIGVAPPLIKVESYYTKKVAKKNVVDEQLEKFKQQIGEFENIVDKDIAYPNIQLSCAGQQFSLLKYILRFLFDLIICFPLYIIKTFVQMFKDLANSIKDKNTRLFFLTLLAYLLDIFTALSVVFLFGSILFAPTDTIYYQWCFSCFMMFISYLLLTAFVSTTADPPAENEENKKITEKLSELFTIKHLNNLGLGRFQDMWLHNNNSVSKENSELKELDIKSNQDGVLSEQPIQAPHEQSESNRILRKRLANSFYSTFHTSIDKFDLFFKEIHTIFGQLGQESCFLEFALLGDSPGNQLSANEMLASNKNFFLRSNSLTDISGGRTKELIKSGYYTSRRGIDLLWKIYQKSVSQLEVSKASRFVEIMILTVIITFKIVIPFIYAVGFHSQEVRGFELMTIMMFYIYIISLFYSIIDNLDLKRRTFILESLGKIIDFTQANETSIDNILDFTCPVSLSCWDSLRRAAMMLDLKKTKYFESIYLFFGIYGSFTFFILVMVVFDVEAIVPKKSVFHTPLYVLIITIDFFFIFAMVLTRIYFGSKFNETFSKFNNIIQRILSIFENIDALTEPFFETKGLIENGYKVAIHKTMEKAEFALLKRRGDAGRVDGNKLNMEKSNDIPSNFQPPGSKLFNKQSSKINPEEKEIYLRELKYELNQKIKAVKKTLYRVKSQMEFDSKLLSHKFLGIFTSTFQYDIIQLSVFLLPLLPPLINKLSGIDSNKKS